MPQDSSNRRKTAFADAGLMRLIAAFRMGLPIGDQIVLVLRVVARLDQSCRQAEGKASAVDTCTV